MKTLAMILLTCLMGCASLQRRHTQETNSTTANDGGSHTTPSGYPLNYVKEASNLPSRIALCSADEPGESMVISGTVFEADGVTPVNDAVVYFYQTDVRGVYSDEECNDGCPKLRGYLKTDVYGGYEIHSIKPGNYPHIKAPAHVHVHIEAPNQPEYQALFQFYDDPLISDERRAKRDESPNEFGLIKLMPDDKGVHYGVRNIKAPPNAAANAAALLAAKTPLDRQLLELEQDTRGEMPKEMYDPLVAALKAEAAEVPNDALERELRKVLDHQIGFFVQFRPHRFIYISDAGNVEIERKFPEGTGPQHPLETRTNEVLDVQLHEHGDTAVMNWLDVDRVRMKDQRFSSSARHTTVFVKRADKWQLISWQISPVGFERAEASVDPQILDSYAGTYENPLLGIYTVSREGNSLVFTSANGYRTEYLPESDTEFFEKDEETRKATLQTVSFVRNDKGQVTHCVFRQNDGQNIVVKKAG